MARCPYCNHIIDRIQMKEVMISESQLYFDPDNNKLTVIPVGNKTKYVEKYFRCPYCNAKIAEDTVDAMNILRDTYNELKYNETDDMEYEEFYKLATDGYNGRGNWKYFFSIASTEFDEDGVPLYNSCNFCSYKTKQTEEYGHGADYEIHDQEIIQHVWDKHRNIAIKIFKRLKAEDIATRKGQTKLIEFSKIGELK